MYNQIINENGINVFTMQNDMSIEVQIWAVEYVGGIPYANLTIKNGRIVKEKLPEDPMLRYKDKHKPLMTIPRHFAIPLMKAMVEHLDQNGAKTKDHNLIEGELNATKQHVADLQAITLSLLDKIK